MNQENSNYYPSIGQSFGILGILILAMVIFTPVMFLLEKPTGKEFATFAYYILSMGISFWLLDSMSRKRNANFSYNFKIKRISIVPLIVIASLAIGFGITMPLTSLVPIPESLKKVFAEMGTQNGVFAFLTLVIAAPLLEELIFRGIILKGLLRNTTPVVAILLSSFIFGFVHLNPWQFITGFSIGLFMGWIYYKTNSLSTTIIIHASLNLTGYIARLFINAEESIDESLVETYGGMTQTIIIVTVSLVALLLCIYFLNKEFNKETDEIDLA